MKRLRFFLALILTPHLFPCMGIGQVTNVLPNGATYIGDWADGQPNGQGTMTSPAGAVYVGEFQDGKPNGHGVSTLSVERSTCANSRMVDQMVLAPS